MSPQSVQLTYMFARDGPLAIITTCLSFCAIMTLMVHSVKCRSYYNKQKITARMLLLGHFLDNLATTVYMLTLCAPVTETWW